MAGIKFSGGAQLVEANPHAWGDFNGPAALMQKLAMLNGALGAEIFGFHELLFLIQG